MTRPKRQRRVPHASAAGGLTEKDMAEVERVAVEKAKQGDPAAAAIVDRLWRARGRMVTLDLPRITDARSVVKAQARVIAGIAKRKVTPREAADVSKIIEWYRHALETVEYQRALEEIEEHLAKQAAQAKKERK
jgi:hypothetical protein